MRKILPLNQLNKNQDGFVAFAVTFIMIIVLSLIVLGFAENSRNEQQNALNNQLSSAAFYAAESGVNDAYTVITADQTHDLSIVPQTTNCTSDNSGNDTYGTASTTSTLDPSTGGSIGYSCLFVNPSPPSLNYAPISVGSGQIVPLFGETTAGAASNISTLTISWQEPGQPTPTNYSLCPAVSSPPAADFPPLSGEGSYSSECGAGVLQIDLVPNTATAFSNLTTSTDTVYLEPVSYSGANATDPAAAVTNGAVVQSQCSSANHVTNSEYDCTAKLEMPSSDVSSYYARIVPFYDSADVAITATGSGGAQLDLASAQTLIDATGKANDVLKRIQERVCTSDYCSNNSPVAALVGTGGVCKDFTTRPGISTGTGITGCTPATGTAPAPTPPNPSPTPNPNGNANYSGCPAGSNTVDCPAPTLQTGPGAERTFYVAYLENTSDNGGVPVVSCSWDWGSWGGYSNVTTNTACQPGEFAEICYGSNPADDYEDPPYYSGNYTITLTVHLANGATATHTSVNYEPYQTNEYVTGSTGCSEPTN